MHLNKGGLDVFYTASKRRHVHKHNFVYTDGLQTDTAHIATHCVELCATYASMSDHAGT